MAPKQTFLFGSFILYHFCEKWSTNILAWNHTFLNVFIFLLIFSHIYVFSYFSSFVFSHSWRGWRRFIAIKSEYLNSDFLLHLLAIEWRRFPSLKEKMWRQFKLQFYFWWFSKLLWWNSIEKALRLKWWHITVAIFQRHWRKKSIWWMEWRKSDQSFTPRLRFAYANERRNRKIAKVGLWPPSCECTLWWWASAPDRCFW